MTDPRRAEPEALVRVKHRNGKTYHVLASALDADGPFLNTYTSAGVLKVARNCTCPISREYLS